MKKVQSIRPLSFKFPQLISLARTDGHDKMCTCHMRWLLYILDGGAKETAAKFHEGFGIEVGFAGRKGERRPELFPEKVELFIYQVGVFIRLAM